MDDEFEDEFEQVLLDETITFNSSDKLIIASIKLPFTVERTKNGGLKLVESQDYIYSSPSLLKLRENGHLNFSWIGWPDFVPKNIEEKT